MDTEVNKSNSGANSGTEIKREAVVQDSGPPSEKVVVKEGDIPTIFLEPEQVEEIHSDNYSFIIFHATRMQPLSLSEIRKQFPEPESGKAQSALDRFLKVGVLHVTSDGKYYSNYPENYLNFSHYRYDADLEAKKDARVFQILKENYENESFWKDKAYFSVDGFMSPEQSTEIREMLRAARLKMKYYINENAKAKSVKGLKFRRIKLYDVYFSILFAALVLFTAVPKSFAGGSGNEPVALAKAAMDVEARSILHDPFKAIGGTGNEPTMVEDISGARGPVGHEPPWPIIPPETGERANGGTAVVNGVACSSAGAGTIGDGISPQGGSDDGTEDSGDGGPRGGTGHEPVGWTTGVTACSVDVNGGTTIYSVPCSCKLMEVIEAGQSCHETPKSGCDEIFEFLSSITVSASI